MTPGKGGHLPPHRDTPPSSRPLASLSLGKAPEVKYLRALAFLHSCPGYPPVGPAQNALLDRASGGSLSSYRPSLRRNGVARDLANGCEDQRGQHLAAGDHTHRDLSFLSTPFLPSAAAVASVPCHPNRPYHAPASALYLDRENGRDLCCPASGHLPTLCPAPPASGVLRLLSKSPCHRPSLRLDRRPSSFHGAHHLDPASDLRSVGFAHGVRGPARRDARHNKKVKRRKTRSMQSACMFTDTMPSAWNHRQTACNNSGNAAWNPPRLLVRLGLHSSSAPEGAATARQALPDACLVGSCRAGAGAGRRTDRPVGAPAATHALQPWARPAPSLLP